MAPETYWMSYLRRSKAGDWWPQLERFAADLNDTMGLQSHFIALRDAHFEMGLDGNPPQLTGACIPVEVEVADLVLDPPNPVRSGT